MRMQTLVVVIASLLSHSAAQVESVNHSKGVRNDDEETSIDAADMPLFSFTGYPDVGDIPVLNRKMFRAHRVTAQEYPYVVSIRRNLSHYLTGALVKTHLVISVAHPLKSVPVHELGIVASETYNDRGTSILTVLLVMIHQAFDPYTLVNDIALLCFYESLYINVPYRGDIKQIPLAHRSAPLTGKAFVTGWGRCDLTGKELCLPRSTTYYPHEPMGPMLRSIRIDLEENPYCHGYELLGLKLAPGMLCVGAAREKESTAACLAVPGAPLVARGKLLGIASWGFGCGFNRDLPLIYTDVRKYLGWFKKINMKFRYLTKTDFYELFSGTKAYIYHHILAETRIRKKNDTRTGREEEFTLIKLDNTLAELLDLVKSYDVRDFVYGGAFHQKKKAMYNELAYKLNWIKLNVSRVEKKEL